MILVEVAANFIVFKRVPGLINDGDTGSGMEGLGNCWKDFS